MANRLNDNTIWKKQRWFKKLSPINKLAWKYIVDTCDHAGIYKIDYGEIVDDLGIEDFDLCDFIDSCNMDFDKETGKKIKRERLILVDKTTLWITGFIRFQYENKSDLLVKTNSPAIYSALSILYGLKLLKIAEEKDFFKLSEPYVNGRKRIS